MSEAIKPKCCGIVYHNYSSSKCGRGASMEHEGKWYCKTHHPPTVQAKRDARTAQLRVEIAERCRRDKERRDAAAEQKRRADCYEQLVERVKELEEALGKLAKSYERVMQMGALPPDSLKAARAALSKSLPTVAEVK